MLRPRAVLALFLFAVLGLPLPTLHVHYARGADHHDPLVHAHFGAGHGGSQRGSSLSGHDFDTTYIDDAAPIPPSFDASVEPAIAGEPLDPTADASRGAAARQDTAVSVHGPPLLDHGLRAPPPSLAAVV